MFDVEIFRRPIYLKNYSGIAKSDHFESVLLALSIHQKSSFVCKLFPSFADEAALRSWDVFVFMWKMFLQFDCAIHILRIRNLCEIWLVSRFERDGYVTWELFYYLSRCEICSFLKKVP